MLEVSFEAFKEFLSTARSRDEHVAAVAFVANAPQIAERAERVQGARDHRLGDAQPLGEAAHRVRAGGEIDEQHQRHLAVGEIGLAGAHIVDQRVHPAAEGLVRHGFYSGSPWNRRFGGKTSQAPFRFPFVAKRDRPVRRRSGRAASPRRRGGRARRRPSAARAWPRAARRRCRDAPKAVPSGHELLQEQGGGHRARQRRFGDVAEIGDVGGEHLLIMLPERHPPQRVGNLLALRQQRVGERVVIGEQGGKVGAERDPRGAGQGGEIEDQLGLLLGRAGERVGEDQPPLRVGIADLDGEPLAALQDVAGPEGVAGDGILDRRDDQVQADRQAAEHDQAGEGERVRGAAHVLLHQPHARRRLEVEPARIEADALADDRDPRMAPVAPFQLDQPRRAAGARGAADRGDHRIALVERLAGGDRRLGAARLGERAGRRLQLGRAEVAGGRVDEVADQEGRFGDQHGLLDPRRLVGQQHARALAAVLLLVAVEAILAEQPAEHRRAGPAARHPVAALGQALRRLGEAPGRRARRHWRRRAPPTSRRARPGRMASWKPSPLKPCAASALPRPRRLRLQPGVEAAACRRDGGRWRAGPGRASAGI